MDDATIDPSRYRLRRFPNGIFRIVWTVDRVTRSRSTGATTEAEAALALADYLRQLAHPGERPTVAQINALYLDDRRDQVVDFPRLQRSVKAINRHLGHRFVDELRPADSRRYAQTRKDEGRGYGTSGYELRQLRAALRFAADEQLIERAPAVRVPPRPDPKPHWITRDEFVRFLAECSRPWLRLFVLLAIHTGARKGAILGLTWDRVDLEAGVIDFGDPAKRTTKKGRAIVPINQALGATLEQARGEQPGPRIAGHVIQHRGRPIGDPRRAFRTAALRAGLPQLTPHVLRHSVATWLADGGFDVRLIAAMLGHSDPRTTERVYIHRHADSLRPIADALDG